MLAAPVAGVGEDNGPPPPRSDCSEAGPPSCFGQAGFDGRNRRTESVNVPARISRVAVVPGSGGNDVWAIGHVTTYKPGWNPSDDGQLVFLRNKDKQGWTVVGPPRDGNTVINPGMTAMAMTPSGEGWAVGQAGKMLHYQPGDTHWKLASLCPSVTCKTILAISLSPDGQSGYAVGADGLTLRLQSGVWSIDRPVNAPGNLPVTLVGVAVTPSGEAWAIAGSSTEQSSKALEIYRRGGTSWDEVDTGKPELENATPSVDGGNVQFGVRGKTVAADGLGNVWFGGGLFPVDPANPLGDANAGGSERPFTLRWKSPNVFTSYCPVVYTFANDQANEQPVCDQPMPMGAFDVTTLAGLADGQMFAGGFGLYHYRPTGTFGSWYREPDPIGFVGSVSFADDREGWFASTGDAIGAQAALSSSIAVGHYTNQPEPAVRRIARWPLPTTAPINAVAMSPTGASFPIAIAEGGLTFTLTSDGWQLTGAGASVSYTSAAYVGSTNVAWAVGAAGNFLRFQNGFAEDRSLKTTTRPGRFDGLFGVAFSSAGRGWAVGAGGALVYYAPGEDVPWIADAQSGTLTNNKTLYSVAAVGQGFVAVGDDATVLVNPSGLPGGWSKVDAVQSLLQSNGGRPRLYAVDATTDGTIVAGGTRSSLIIKRPAGSWELAPVPPEGTIYALQARVDVGSNAVKLVASIGPHGIPKFNGMAIGTTQAWLSNFDGAIWHDLQNGNHKRLADGLDYALHPDAIVNIVATPDGRSGWAVGGRPEGLVGLDDNSLNDKTSTGSIYRFDLDGDPRSEYAREAVIEANTPKTKSAYSFAFFSDTSCGSTLCSLTIGSGTKSDEVAQRIRDDINAAAGKEGGPKFVLFGGSARGSGTREELAAFAGYLEGFNIPVFGAPGARDLTIPTVASGAQPPALPFGLQYPTDVNNETRTVGSTRFYQEELARMPAPWGAAPALDEFAPAPEVLPTSRYTPGRARTHYAFDYLPAGATKSLGRFIFVDTSTRTLSTTGQNPIEPQGQGAWLSQMILDARQSAIPTYVVMNVPPRNPLSNTMMLQPGDVQTIEQTVYSGGATAVFAGGVRGNATYRTPPGNVPGSVPFYIAGTAGAPPSGTKWSTDGHFHSWLLGVAETAAVGALTPQASLQVRSIPVTDSIALVAPEGTVVRGGNILKFDAFSRSIDGGHPSGDRGAANATFLKYPIRPPCSEPGESATSLNTVCYNKGGLVPDYQFLSDDPTIADFVMPLDDLQRTTPFRDSGRLVKNDKIGFLCTFRVGTTNIRIRSGGREAVLPITVLPGDGPCVESPVVEPEEIPGDVDPVPQATKPIVKSEPTPAKPKPPKAVTPAPPPKPAPAPPPPPQEPPAVSKPVPKHFFTPQPVPQPVPALLPPAPSMIPSPAPPASASAAGAEKQEDKEVEHEGAGQEGGEFVAIRHRRADNSLDIATGLMLAATAAILGVFGAAVAATKSNGRRPVPARVVYPRELR